MNKADNRFYRKKGSEYIIRELNADRGLQELVFRAFVFLVWFSLGEGVALIISLVHGPTRWLMVPLVLGGWIGYRHGEWVCR